MKILYILLRLVVFYFLFRIAFKAVFWLLRLFFQQPHRYGPERTVKNKGHRRTDKAGIDKQDVVDAEFEEIKD